MPILTHDVEALVFNARESRRLTIPAHTILKVAEVRGSMTYCALGSRPFIVFAAVPTHLLTRYALTEEEWAQQYAEEMTAPTPEKGGEVGPEATGDVTPNEPTSPEAIELMGDPLAKVPKRKPEMPESLEEFSIEEIRRMIDQHQELLNSLRKEQQESNKPRTFEPRIMQVEREIQHLQRKLQGQPTTRELTMDVIRQEPWEMEIIGYEGRFRVRDIVNRWGQFEGFRLTDILTGEDHVLGNLDDVVKKADEIMARTKASMIHHALDEESAQTGYQQTNPGQVRPTTEIMPESVEDATLELDERKWQNYLREWSRLMHTFNAYQQASKEMVAKFTETVKNLDENTYRQQAARIREVITTYQVMTDKGKLKGSLEENVYASFNNLINTLKNYEFQFAKIPVHQRISIMMQGNKLRQNVKAAMMEFSASILTPLQQAIDEITATPGPAPTPAPTPATPPPAAPTPATTGAT